MFIFLGFLFVHNCFVVWLVCWLFACACACGWVDSACVCVFGLFVRSLVRLLVCLFVCLLARCLLVRVFGSLLVFGCLHLGVCLLSLYVCICACLFVCLFACPFSLFHATEVIGDIGGQVNVEVQVGPNCHQANGTPREKLASKSCQSLLPVIRLQLLQSQSRNQCDKYHVHVYPARRCSATSIPLSLR